MIGTPGDIALRAHEGEVHAVLVGEVDLDAVSRLKEERDHVGVVHAVDSSALTFLDSSGLRFLLGLTALNPGIRLVDPSPVLLELLEITGTAGMFRVA
ncbi:STAS domain-containing protein [Georgenia muralis]|uniref:Anti-anti-sigma regulatory factor n=1 Tax=Georgenia muralis TaxID=154117 RepID=A0A3N4Z9U3_9MICO|nr:STAS domain-containing protein [Georgenia muralis]RPF28883.1 anti-anti-sigma regulatory factor [Georgenia muralis]